MKKLIPLMLAGVVLIAGFSRGMAGNRKDWLIDPSGYRAVLDSSVTGRIAIGNGLINRTFQLHPNAVCIGFEDLENHRSLLRGVKPEALLVIDGVSVPVGGLTGQPDYAYLTEQWIARLEPVPGSMVFSGYRTGPIRERLAWKRVRHAAPDVKWPPPGIHLEMDYRMPENGAAGDLQVTVHYEVYDGIPVICKWISLQNRSGKSIRLNRFTSEILAVVEKDSPVEERGTPIRKPDLFVETDYSFGGMETLNTTVHSVCWIPDPDYATQVNYNRMTPCLLEVRPEIGPDQVIPDGGSFESFRAWELVKHPFDEERTLLAQRRMYRLIAPWVTENPVMMHIRNSDPERVKAAIDQCAETGFEMGIITFGSGFDLESRDPAYISQWKELAGYAHSKGVELGGYSLLSSRSISAEDDVINPETGKPGGVIHGNAPCIGSEWGADYMEQLYSWYKATGMNLLEHDGSYPGHVCASSDHPGHRGKEDSQWTQWKTITGFYSWCRSEGIYLNIPDWYYLNGGSKCGMGYREVNWSLPREQQLIHARQNIFDGTREKAPSMGWMFVPLTEYHGGGAAATIEPLNRHLGHYGSMLALNLGNGVQACYRGPRLYDTDSTREMVTGWVSFYKQHRDILESDVIHSASRRADGRDIDWMFHANPALREKGFLMLFNPTDRVIRKEIQLPLYYTGLTETARISGVDGKATELKLDRQYRIRLEVEVPARSQTWYVIE